MTDDAPDDLTCECEGCGAPLVCFICDSCPEHCLTNGDPDACWEAHESWRLGKGDPTFETVAARATKPGRRVTLNGAPIPPAPKPRKRT